MALHFSEATPVDTKTIHHTAKEDGDGEGRRISRSLSPGLWGRSSPVMREKKKRRGGCNGGEWSHSLGGGFQGPETKVSDWNSDPDPLFLLVYGNPRRIERCCCCGTSTVSLVWRVGRCLAETEREGGSARLKRIWQSEVTGPGREEEEAGVAGRDNSLVTETAGFEIQSVFAPFVHSAFFRLQLSQFLPFPSIKQNSRVYNEGPEKVFS